MVQTFGSARGWKWHSREYAQLGEGLDYDLCPECWAAILRGVSTREYEEILPEMAQAVSVSRR